MMEHGIQRFMVDNAIPLVVPSGWVDSSKLMDKVDTGVHLPKLTFTDEGSAQFKVIAVGGQHRKYALRKVEDALKRFLEGLQNKHRKKKGSAGQDEIHKLEMKIAGVRYWMVAVHALGEQCIIISSTNHHALYYTGCKP
jgi:hypothetical protein